MIKKIFITGSSGFVGKSLIKYLKKKKLSIAGTGFKNNKNNKIDLTKKIIFKKKFNWIIHTAAHHKIKDFENKPNLKGKRNILMVKNLIEFAKANRIKKFIYFSTIDINYRPFPKKKIIYCKSKIYCEKILKLALKKNIFEKIIILRLPAIVGKNANNVFLINTLKKLKKNLTVNIWNMNTKYNNLIHINDLNKLILYNILRFKNNKKKIVTVDCLSSKPVKLKKLIEYLKNKTKSKSKINYLYKKNKFKKIQFNSKINYKFFGVKRVADLLI